MWQKKTKTCKVRKLVLPSSFPGWRLMSGAGFLRLISGLLLSWKAWADVGGFCNINDNWRRVTRLPWGTVDAVYKGGTGGKAGQQRCAGAGAAGWHVFFWMQPSYSSKKKTKNKAHYYIIQGKAGRQHKAAHVAEILRVFTVWNLRGIIWCCVWVLSASQQWRCAE